MVALTASITLTSQRAISRHCWASYGHMATMLELSISFSWFCVDYVFKVDLIDLIPRTLLSTHLIASLEHSLLSRFGSKLYIFPFVVQ